MRDKRAINYDAERNDGLEMTIQPDSLNRLLLAQNKNNKF